MATSTRNRTQHPRDVILSALKDKEQSRKSFAREVSAKGIACEAVVMRFLRGDTETDTGKLHAMMKMLGLEVS